MKFVDEVGRRITINTVGKFRFEELIKKYFGESVDLNGFFSVSLGRGLELVNPKDGHGYFFSSPFLGERKEYIDTMLENVDEQKIRGFNVSPQFVDCDAQVAGFSWRVKNG